jgi:signal transduction histidine kinase
MRAFFFVCLVLSMAAVTLGAARERNHPTSVAADLTDGAMVHPITLVLGASSDETPAEVPETTATPTPDTPNPDEVAAAREVIVRAVDRLNAAIADLRGYVLGLRPVRGSDRPLTESLPTLAEQARSNALLDVEVAVSEEAADALDRPAREATFYIAADALGNVARHARAQRASLRLFLRDSHVVLEVTDNGVGFDYANATEGHGLRNMRERAFAVGGQLHVEAAPGHGSRLRFEVPIRSEVAP